jgi:hypothetical protein
MSYNDDYGYKQDKQAYDPFYEQGYNSYRGDGIFAVNPDGSFVYGGGNSRRR